MRKRVINHVADTIFWYILYFLPVLAYLMFVISAPFRDIVKEEGFAPSVEYREQWYYNLPADYPIQVFNSIETSFTAEYYPLIFAKSVANPDPEGDNMLYRYPVIATLDTNERPFVEGTPLMVLRETTSTTFRFRLASPLKIPVPYDGFFAKNTIYLMEFRGSTNTNCCSILPGNTITPDFYSVEYVATELADGMTYDFKDFVNSMGFEFATDNIIVNSLSDIFGTGGIMPMFDNDTPFIIFAWFIGVYLLHLLVDFLLFIPRIAHKWMKDCTGGD